MPKRDFIPNVDDANAELQRLDDQIAQLNIDKQTLTGQVTELATLKQNLTAKDSEIGDLKGQLTTKDTKIGELTSTVDGLNVKLGEKDKTIQTEKTKATKVIAKAGVDPQEETASTTVDGEEDPLKGLTGLARATAANAQRIKANKLGY